MEPHIQYAKTSDGVNIAFWTLGEGRPIVVMPSPPFSHIQAEWQWPEARHLYERLARTRKLVRFDGRGAGLSDRNVTEYSLETHVNDLEAVVSRSEIGDIALMAAADAGPVAIAYAARYPEQVSQLVLWGTYAKGGFGDQVEIQALYELVDRDWNLFVQTLCHSVVGWSHGEYGSRFAELLLQSTSPRAAKAAFAASFEFDVSSLLPRVQSPTLILHPSTVRWADGDQARLLASQIHDARLVVLDDATGVLWWEQSGSVIRAAEAFLNEEGADATASSQAVLTGMTAILFADIADSTALTERLGDAAFRAKARDLDGALRAAIREHSGTCIDAKTLGDGVLATFTSAAKAIEAALACGRAGDGAGLALHLGLHAGDVIREENNVFGGAVNIAARISALSAPGEVLVSDTLRGLARSSAGVSFEDHGEHALKGIGEPVRVYAVR